MKFYCSLLLLLGSVFLQAQSVKAYEKAGDKAYASEETYTAMVHYASALELEPNNARLNYKYALTAQDFFAFEVALEYFEKVANSKEFLAFPELNYHLGQVHKQLGKYEAAKDFFRKYLNLQSTEKDPALMERAEQEIKNCNWAKAQTQSPDPFVRVLHLDRQVNTSYSEFGPLPVGDTLYYTSYRYTNKADKHDPPRRISKVLNSLDGDRGRPMRRRFNVDGKSTAHLSFSTVGDRVYFTICDYAEAGGIRCDLYYREKDRRGNWESTPTKLPEHINSDQYTCTQPCIAWDPVREEERLYFASNRPGGKGGLDIWYTVIDGKKFGKPENLEVVNTPYDDATPFYHVEKRRLFFASQGHPNNMGGYDIYYSQQDSLNWEKPVNLGAPLNTSYNDLYYYLEPDAKSGYLSSNRPGSMYLDKNNKACCNDIYLVQFLEPNLPEDPEVTVPVVDVPPPPTVPEMPTRLEDFLPLALYFDNDEPDRRTRRTTTKKSYADTYFPYYARRNEYVQEYTEPMDDEELILLAEERIADFFQDEVRKGFDHLERFSEILLDRLRAGDEVEIFVKGFTSPRAKSDYNLALGQRRISSIRNYFDRHADGVFQEYLKNGQLIISEKSFGETTASQEVSDALEDYRNSIYSVEAAKERRVEIVEIKRTEN